MQGNLFDYNGYEWEGLSRPKGIRYFNIGKVKIPIDNNKKRIIYFCGFFYFTKINKFYNRFI